MAGKRPRFEPGRETRRLVAWVERNCIQARVYGADPDAVALKAQRVVGKVLRGARLGRAMENELGWFAADIGRALCYARGAGLAFELRQLLSRWLRLGLERRTVELLLRMVLEEVGGLEIGPEPVPGAAGEKRHGPA